MSLSKSSVQQRGGFYLQQELQDCSPMTHFPEWLKTLLSMKSLQVASLPMPGRWQFFCSPASFYHGSFPPKTLKSPVSCLVTINAHFLLCFKPETTSFALFFASPTAPPAFLLEIVFLLCISQMWAGSSAHPVIPHCTVISPVSVSEVVSGVLLSTH